MPIFSPDSPDWFDRLDDESYARSVAIEHNAMMVHLDENYHIPPDVIALVPPEIARRYSFIPLYPTDDDALFVATIDFSFEEGIAEYFSKIDRKYEICICPKDLLLVAIDHYYGSS